MLISKYTSKLFVVIAFKIIKLYFDTQRYCSHCIWLCVTKQTLLISEPLQNFEKFVKPHEPGFFSNE